MSCNFLSQRVIDVKGSDTLSEISESGTGTSGWTSGWDSREDLRDFVTKLGLQDVSDLYQDRFRIDRKKLEQMLSGENDGPLPADVFFEQIMADTETFITWPSKLKIGAKSKKDPHVRIAGRPEDVQAAKERIMTILDTRCNRVTMKMDVSYTDHSHIIGKGGLSIKRVMEETQCHVHFPDSNRSNPMEKSNQVSISGDIEGVESARSRVRELIPLIFGFELPIMSQNVDLNAPYIEKVQEQYRVQVMLKTRPKLHATYVLVKGVEWEIEQVKQATLLLMDFMCENLAGQIPVQMSMEISPHHHPTVMGKSHSNLKTIMQYTNCQIMFPDALDPNIPSLKKSNVNISGNIHGVYKARQLLMGSLPLLIIFDLPEESVSLRTKPEQLADFQNDYDVTINIRQKAKLNIKACVIKGIERNAANVYKVRNLILGVDEPFLNANIPPSYYMPQNPSPINIEIPPPITINPPPISPLMSPLISPTWQLPSPYQPPFVGLMKQPQFMFNVMQGGTSYSSSGYHSSLGQYSNGSLSLEQSHDNSGYNSSISSIHSISPSRSPRMSVSPKYQKPFSESPSENMELLSSALSEMSSCGGYHGPSVDKRQDRLAFSPSDFEQKRLAGLRAMQNQPTGGYRVPTGSWSGYGISQTSPAGLGASASTSKSPSNTPCKTREEEEMSSPSSILNMSNFMEHTPTQTLQRITMMKWADLPSLLTSIGLEKYVRLFHSHEIDLLTFPSLTEQDLIDIGVSAFGARRKILLVIFEMNKRNGPFSAAPGAERRNSSAVAGSPKESWLPGDNLRRS